MYLSCSVISLLSVLHVFPPLKLGVVGFCEKTQLPSRAKEAAFGMMPFRDSQAENLGGRVPVA